MKSLAVVASLGLGVAACATAAPPRWNVDKSSSLERVKTRTDVRRCESGEGEWCFAAGLSLYANRPIEAVTFDGVPVPELLLEAPELQTSYTSHKAFAGGLFEKGCDQGHMASCIMAARCMQQVELDGTVLFRGTPSSRAKESGLMAEKACKADYLVGCQLLHKAASVTGDKDKVSWAAERIVALGGAQS